MAWSMDANFDQVNAILNQLDGGGLEKAASRALFKGADRVADQMKAALEALPTEPFRMADDAHPREASPQEKAMLLRKMGIAKHKHETDSVSTSVGIGAGYALLYGNHRVPVVVIARAINSGASFRIKRPFARKAAKGANETIARTLNEELEKLTRE